MEPNLSILEKAIIEIANILNLSNKEVDLHILFEIVKENLDETDEEINKAIYSLILKKYIAVKSEMPKKRVLLNAKRYRIYHFILRNPGSKFNDVKKFVNLREPVLRWHLAILEGFEFIYSTDLRGVRLFFPKEFDKFLIAPYLSVKNPNSYKIFLILWEKPVLQIETLNVLSQMPLERLQSQLRELINSKVIKETKINNKVYYYLNPDILILLQRFLKIDDKNLTRFLDYQKEILKIKREETKLPHDDTQLVEEIGTEEEPSDEISSTATEVFTESRKRDSDKVRVLREYDYLGGKIRFKIVIENISNTILTNFNVNLIPTTQYKIDERVKIVDVLKPGETRGVDFILTPETCGKSKIYGTVSFIDAFGDPQTVTIRPKELWIKCPLVVPKKRNLTEIEALKSELARGATDINFSDLSELEIFKLVQNQVSSLDLSEVAIDHENMTLIYAGVTKVTGNDMIIEGRIKNQIIHLEVWTKDIKQVTGFLAYIQNMINIAIISIEKNKRISGPQIDKISQKIFDASEIVSILERLCLDCEENWFIGDILVSLKKALVKIEKNFHGTSLENQIKDNIKKFENSFREELSIDNKTGINLEYQAINWLKTTLDFALNNLEIYKETFPKAIEKIVRLEQITQDMNTKIKQLEQFYISRILLYLILIDRNSGLILYEYGFKKSDFAPDLLSGFLTAIQHFGTEFSKEDTSMRKITYENLEIEMYAGSYSICTLLADGLIPENLSLLMRKFLSTFETKYENVLKNWSGDVLAFKDVDNLIKEFFSKNLINESFKSDLYKNV
ncbi:MAG: hypothetical protein ACTSYB_00070 [Candidatus Helarchaeota archaeon]